MNIPLNMTDSKLKNYVLMNINPEKFKSKEKGEKHYD